MKDVGWGCRTEMWQGCKVRTWQGARDAGHWMWDGGWVGAKDEGWEMQNVMGMGDAGCGLGMDQG